MSFTYTNMTQESYQIVLTMFEENIHLKQLREESLAIFPERAHIQISPDQAQFMQILTKSRNIKTILEVGTFCGYSAMAMGLALPADGQIITCDINQEYGNFALKHWKAANLTHKITLKLAPALDTMRHLKEENYIFDLIFIDANESQYEEYLAHALDLSRPGSLIMIDNVLALNGILHTEGKDSRAETVLKFNENLSKQKKIDTAIVPMGGGMAICYVK